MTKNDIVVCIARHMKMRQADAKQVVQLVLDGIIHCLAEEKRVELRNFGVFEVKHRRARTARNPRTGERVSVPEKNVVTFRAGRVLRQEINEPRGQSRDVFGRGALVPPEPFPGPDLSCPQ